MYKTLNIKNAILFLFCIQIHSFSYAQEETTQKPLGYEEFLNRVGQYNLDYNAELLALDIVLAEAESAKVFENPNLSFEVTDNRERKIQMGYELESSLEWNLELGGKRKARINVAQNEVELTRILLSDYFKNLRADATLQFLNAIKEKNILDVKVNSFETMLKLAHSDSIRYELGDIMEIDARQSKLEAISLLNEVTQQMADWKNALYDLNNLMSHELLDSLYFPKGRLNNFSEVYDLQNLISTAQENRNDLKIALQNKKINQGLLRLIKAERKTDLGLAIGVGTATIVNNEIPPSPAFKWVTAGITVPLKFSNRNKGELKAAQYAINQSEMLYKASEIKIKTEVHQAYTQFKASHKQANQFDTNLLQSAERILAGKTYSYQRGETSLLEVLDAQRTFNEVQENYHETQYAYEASLIELQRIVGIWEIKFDLF